MLLKLLLSLVGFFTRPFHGPVDEIPFEITSYGPQNLTDANEAFEALYNDNQNDDMRFHEDWPESAGIRDERFRWPGYPGKATIPFEIDGSVRDLERKINDAIKQYHDNTCIRFVKRTNQQHYVKIIKDRGCYSYVGLQKRGGQPLSLGRGCGFVGTIVHELGHAIGLYHEHQRSDRDQYLKVNENNVVSGQIHNFKKTPANKELKWSKYDYTSIMHYGNYAFSKRPGQLKTMEAKNGTPLKEPYEKPGLNSIDIDLVKKLYKCR